MVTQLRTNIVASKLFDTLFRNVKSSITKLQIGELVHVQSSIARVKSQPFFLSFFVNFMLEVALHHFSAAAGFSHDIALSVLLSTLIKSLPRFLLHSLEHTVRHFSLFNLQILTVERGLARGKLVNLLGE